MVWSNSSGKWSRSLKIHSDHPMWKYLIVLRPGLVSRARDIIECMRYWFETNSIRITERLPDLNPIEDSLFQPTLSLLIYERFPSPRHNIDTVAQEHCFLSITVSVP